MTVKSPIWPPDNRTAQNYLQRFNSCISKGVDLGKIVGGYNIIFTSQECLDILIDLCSAILHDGETAQSTFRSELLLGSLCF